MCEGLNKMASEDKRISARTLVLAVLCAIVFMFLAGIAVFFATVRGSEEVLVPNVVGKDWSEALIEMQQKELYPKVQLRYTDSADDAGKILGQSPIGGSITKAGSRIALTISRGVVVSRVENFVGQNIDDVRMNLQSMFSGTKPLIIVGSPSYKEDQSPAGTILSQSVPEGTAISTPITINFVVSRGMEEARANVPNLVGMSVPQVLKLMESSKIIFNFTSHIAESGEKAGTVSSQQDMGAPSLAQYSRMNVELAFPGAELNGKIYGVLQASLPNYPTPVSMTLESVKDERRTTLATFRHIGGYFSVPYAVEKGTELKVYAASTEILSEKVE